MVAEEPLSKDGQIDAQEKELARLLEWIRQADSKSQIIVGANLALIGAVVGLMPNGAKSNVWSLVLVAGGCLLPGISLFHCLSASQPHVIGPPHSLIYFKRIRGLSFDKYCDAVSKRTGSDYLHDLNNQCHVNAEIADKKYDRIKRAWLCMFGRFRHGYSFC